MSQLERATLAAIPWLVVALALTVLGLLVPGSWDRVTVFVVQLVLLVGFSVALALRLTTYATDDWFGAAGARSVQLIGSGIGIVVLVTGATGLVTLASSAALRFQPSLQFLQLLSALDIAWAAAAVVVGMSRWRGPRWAAWGGAALGVFCIWSIWNYLNTVGLAPDGGWVVDGGELMRLVIPFDTAAAVAAVAIFVKGVSAQRIEQARVQS